MHNTKLSSGIIFLSKLVAENKFDVSSVIYIPLPRTNLRVRQWFIPYSDAVFLDSVYVITECWKCVFYQVSCGEQIWCFLSVIYVPLPRTNLRFCQWFIPYSDAVFLDCMYVMTELIGLIVTILQTFLSLPYLLSNRFKFICKFAFLWTFCVCKFSFT